MKQSEEIRPRTMGAAAAGAAAVLPPIGALVAALNWRHFGKRDWMINSLLILFLYVVLIVLAFVLLARQQTSLIAVVMVLGALVLFWVFYIATTMLQNGAYKHWVKYNTLDDYRYNFPKAIGLSIGVVALAGAAIGVLVFLQSRPNTFTHTDLTISVPSSWAIRSLNDVPGCDVPTDDYTCIGFLSDARFGFTQIFISRERPIEADMTLQDHAENWQYWVEDVQGGRVLSIVDANVSGHPAKRVAGFTPPLPDDRLQEEDYAEAVLIEWDGYLYTFQIWAENAGIFRESQSQVESILNAVTFV